MSVASVVKRMLRGQAATQRTMDLDSELEAQKAIIRQNTQCIQSGSRVMGTMAGMMRIMTEADRESDQ